MQSALEGNGLAAQILHRKNIGTDHGGLALFPGMQGADERVKFAHLLPFLGSVELHQVVFGLHAFHGLAFIFSVDIHQHHILILRQAAFRHIFQARHGTENAAGNLLQFGRRHFGVFHFNFQRGEVFRQPDVVGQNLKTERKGEILVARSLRGIALKPDTGHGMQLFLVQNLRDGVVHQRIGGPGVNFIAKALFQHLGGHLALAEAGQGQIRSEAADSLVDGAGCVSRGDGDRDFALDGRNIFYAVFHSWDNSFIRPGTPPPRKVF